MFGSRNANLTFKKNRHLGWRCGQECDANGDDRSK
jgi:hypothetical protein